jgi:hypothetical protein
MHWVVSRLYVVLGGFISCLVALGSFIFTFLAKLYYLTCEFILIFIVSFGEWFHLCSVAGGFVFRVGFLDSSTTL